MPITPTINDLRDQAEINEKRRQAQQEPPRLHTRRWLDEEPPSRQPSHVPFWVAIALLAASLGGAGWYGLSRLREHDGLLARMSPWGESLSALTGRVSEAETRLRALPAEFDGLTSRIAALDERIAAGRNEARRSVQQLGIALRRELRDAGDAQARSLEARIRELQAARSAEAARTAELEQRVSSLNQRLNAASADIAASREIAAHDARQLRGQIARTDGRVTEAASFHNRARERFSIPRGTTQRIGPGILLHVNRLDPAYRRFDGWLQLVEEGKFLWLKRQGVLQPVGFHAGSDRLRHDLIVTDLSRDGVSGYLILPSEGETAASRNRRAAVAPASAP